MVARLCLVVSAFILAGVIGAAIFGVPVTAQRIVAAFSPTPAPVAVVPVEVKRIEPDPVAPFDIRPVISLIGRFGMAHACPLGPDLVITNAHVTDIEPTSAFALLPSRAWSEVEGDFGLESRGVSYAADLSVMGPVSEIKLQHYFPIALDLPSPGDTLYWVGYDWRHKATMFARRVFSGHVLRVIAGNIIIDRETTKGSSGSCVLDGQGRAVGIIAWGLAPDASKEEVTIAVGIHSIWHNDVTKGR